MAGSGTRTTTSGATLRLAPRPAHASEQARLCFIVEEKYQDEVMPLVVADVLRDWGHTVDVLYPHRSLTGVQPGAGIENLGVGTPGEYDAYVLKTVSDGPGRSVLEAAGVAGARTINDYRAVRVARDKVVAASLARAAGLPFPRTYFAARAQLLHQLPDEAYPLVVKPSNGSACENVHRVDTRSELDALHLDDNGFLLAQPYLPNPGYDVKLYNTGGEVWAVRRKSPLHPGADVLEQRIPLLPELAELALRVGRTFGLDIYGIDVVDTPRGWVVLDVNDFPSFGGVPQAPARLARTILRLASAGTAGRVPSRPVPAGMEATA